MKSDLVVQDRVNDSQRILWVDIYKGIAIILMVIGHATGKFNSYIYQFHMPAFFFISGYVLQKGKRNTLRTIWDKFYSLFIPYFTVFIFMLFFAEITTRLGIYHFFFSEDMPYPGIGVSVSSFFLHGSCYAWWLGAGWFCVILFAIEIIHSILEAICKDNYGIYFILIGVIYYVGYYLVRHNYTFQLSFISNDLAFIGLGFFGMGFLFRQLKIFEKIYLYRQVIVVLLVNIATLYFFSHIKPITVQYPARKFNDPIIDMVAGINGCLLIYALSFFLGKSNCVKKILQYIGKNTLGIVFFHFQFFKMGYLALYLCHVVPITFIGNLVPTDEVGNIWWWLICAVGILLSLIEWKILTGIKGIRFFFGTEKKVWNIFYEKLSHWIKLKLHLTEDYSLASIGEKFRFYFGIPFFWLGCLVILLACIPIWTQGIMCNDELQYYYWNRQGFSIAYKTYWHAWMEQGRFLASFLTPIWMRLSVIGRNIGEYRIIPVLSILLNIVLFGILLYRLFQNKYFALFCSFMILAFLPITFAPMAPNAYTTTFGIPFSFLLGAMILYMDYINKPQIKKGILISLFMMVAFTSYEIFVTYVPLFCLFVLWKNKLKDFKKIVRLCLLPGLTGITYILLYVLCRIWMPSDYAGNNIKFTIRSAAQILFYLGKASFPGYMLSVPAYQYLNAIYNNLRPIDYVRIALLAGTLLVVLCRLIIIGKKEKQNIWSKQDIAIILVALLYTMLPALPIALSSLYQNNVGKDTGFVALPTTYFTYFFATFLCCYILWKILSKYKNALISIILSLIIVTVCIPIQYMNSNFSMIQNDLFKRLQHIEDFLTTNTLMNMGAVQIYSNDIFKTNLSLGVHASYWQDELNRRGSNIQIAPYAEESLFENDTYFLSFINDNYFVMEGQKDIYLAFPTANDTVVVELQEGSLLKVTLENPVHENNYYIYRVDKQNL